MKISLDRDIRSLRSMMICLKWESLWCTYSYSNWSCLFYICWLGGSIYCNFLMILCWFDVGRCNGCLCFVFSTTLFLWSLQVLVIWQWCIDICTYYQNTQSDDILNCHYLWGNPCALSFTFPLMLADPPPPTPEMLSVPIVGNSLVLVYIDLSSTMKRIWSRFYLANCGTWASG